MAYAIATLIWIAAGDVLPGGRWLAVHIFTLGVLTNLVLTFSEHFSRTVTRTSGERAGWWPVVTNVGVLGVLVGVPNGTRWLLTSGAVVLTVTVALAYVRLRRMRRASVGARFGWLVRIYERAHGAFIHGAILGALLGAAVVSGPWYGAVRTAHLHANVLGWGGLTLLATLVFFGPTMARTRIRPGADRSAARALRHGATGLTVAVLALILTGAPGTPGVIARIVAALGLGVYAVAALVVCAPVGRAAAAAKPTAPRPLVVAVCLWLPLAAIADTVVVAAGAWRWLDALGALVLAGVLAQAMFATLLYLAPMLRGRTTGARETLRARLETGTGLRAATFNLGVVLTVLAAARLVDGAPLAALGWGMIGLTVLLTLLTAAWPVRPAGTGPTG